MGLKFIKRRNNTNFAAHVLPILELITSALLIFPFRPVSAKRAFQAAILYMSITHVFLTMHVNPD